MKKKSLLLILSSLFLNLGFSEGIMKSQYEKEDINPIIATKIDPDNISIKYSYLIESSAYSNGVNYEIKDGILFVAINRCLAGEDCIPMIKSLPLDEGFKGEVILPYHGEKIIMKYADMDDELTVYDLVVTQKLLGKDLPMEVKQILE